MWLVIERIYLWQSWDISLILGLKTFWKWSDTAKYLTQSYGGVLLPGVDGTSGSQWSCEVVLHSRTNRVACWSLVKKVIGRPHREEVITATKTQGHWAIFCSYVCKEWVWNALHTLSCWFLWATSLCTSLPTPAPALTPIPCALKYVIICVSLCAYY